MGKRFLDKRRPNNSAYRRTPRPEELPAPLPADPNQRLVEVYVEGYEDVAFWRGIFDHFRTPYLRFEISVPNREDLPKGKKVLLSMVPRSSERLLLCMDSDFDYLFADRTPQSKEVNRSKYVSTLSPTPPRIICVMRPRCTMSASKRPRTIPAFSISCASCANTPARSIRCSSGMPFPPVWIR